MIFWLFLANEWLSSLEYAYVSLLERLTVVLGLA